MWDDGARPRLGDWYGLCLSSVQAKTKTALLFSLLTALLNLSLELYNSSHSFASHLRKDREEQTLLFPSVTV
jgi:hypothetical protein